MGEIKSVKVDNWGVFFLQKLQNFFNKTDYCDLTLQFRDNSQLKVHRLVLSACTDYFNVLEQTCEMVDDALIMPNELQADVVVPIVNFMYTGTLEFELKMYGKLLRTAKDMNMTVLLKLLEAHRRTMEGVNRLQRPPSPKTLRRRVLPATSLSQQQPTVQQRRVLTSPNSVSGMQRRIVQSKTISTNASTSANSQQIQYRQQIGATSLIRTSSGNNSNSMQGRTQYVNQPTHETHQTVIKQEPEEMTPTSPFEQLRKGYNNNKRPANNTLVSPPAKKLNIEDVKEFAEQQRMRKQIAAEYGDDQGEYENSMMEDDIHNDDDDDDMATTSATASAIAGMQPSTSRQTQLQHGATTITINQNEKPPTIVVKDSSNSKMNHAKIIKEVLRQYPHLVKSNKNIKLKIMPSSGDQPQKIIVKKEQLEHISNDPQCPCSSAQSQSVLRVQSSSQTLLKPLEKLQATVHQTTPTPPAVAPKVSPIKPKPATTLPASATSGSGTATASAVPAQKRRIDSKTMHALIALGAENTTGPWLCLRCGVNGRPISIPSYRGFRRHLINTHKEHIDPALCEHCGWRSNTKRELHFHMEIEHKVKTTFYTFPQCLLCSNQFLDTNALNQHMVDAHPDENKQQCIYCNKIFARELQLYNHMKTYHKKQALEDGIIDYSDDELFEPQGVTEVTTQGVQDNISKEKKESKIKIISDISLPSAGAILKLEGSNVATDSRPQIGESGDQQELMETNESSIITSEPKFVTVDGNEMVLTDEQRQEIMAQLNQEHGAGGVVMVLNEPAEYTAEATPTSANHGEMESSREKLPAEQESDHSAERQPENEIMDEETRNRAVENSTADEEFDDSPIYSELHTAQGGQGDSDVREEMGTTDVRDDKKNTSGGSALDESKESIENLEWAENLISAHELADQEEMEEDKKEKENKGDDSIKQKLKELTGDWSEDENDEDHQEAAISPSAEVEAPEDFSSNTVQNVVEETDENILDNQKKTVEEHVKDPKELPEKSIEQEETEAENDIVDPAEDNIIPHDDDPAYPNTTADDSKGEDDLDMLMKNLHKDETDITDIKIHETKDQAQRLDNVVVADDLDVAIKKEKLETPPKEANTQEAETILKSETEKVDKSDVADSIVKIQRDVLLDELIGDDENMPKEEFIKETVPTEKEILKTTGEDSSTGSAAPEPAKALEAMEEDEAETEEEGKEQPAVTDAFENKADAAKDDSAVSGEAAIDDVAKTSERVKSLISEWAEDDEEEEQDTAVPTAITEADEEQL